MEQPSGWDWGYGETVEHTRDEIRAGAARVDMSGHGRCGRVRLLWARQNIKLTKRNPNDAGSKISTPTA